MYIYIYINIYALRKRKGIKTLEDKPKRKQGKEESKNHIITMSQQADVECLWSMLLMGPY
jgi:hypothetical protein